MALSPRPPFVQSPHARLVSAHPGGEVPRRLAVGVGRTTDGVADDRVDLRTSRGGGRGDHRETRSEALGAGAAVGDDEFGAGRSQQGQPPEEQDAQAPRAGAAFDDVDNPPSLIGKFARLSLVGVIALVDTDHRLFGHSLTPLSRIAGLRAAHDSGFVGMGG